MLYCIKLYVRGKNGCTMKRRFSLTEKSLLVRWWCSRLSASTRCAFYTSARQVYKPRDGSAAIRRASAGLGRRLGAPASRPPTGQRTVYLYSPILSLHSSRTKTITFYNIRNFFDMVNTERTFIITICGKICVYYTCINVSRLFFFFLYIYCYYYYYNISALRLHPPTLIRLPVQRRVLFHVYRLGPFVIIIIARFSGSGILYEF